MIERAIKIEGDDSVSTDTELEYLAEMAQGQLRMYCSFDGAKQG